jgi:hypothetical protein
LRDPKSARPAIGRARVFVRGSKPDDRNAPQRGLSRLKPPSVGSKIKIQHRDASIGMNTAGSPAPDRRRADRTEHAPNHANAVRYAKDR